MSEGARRSLGWTFAAACGLLLGWLLWQDVTTELTWRRELVNIDLGLWSTRFLLAVLTITPLSTITREPQLRRLRRPLGLAAVAFGVAHGIQYIVYTDMWPEYVSMLVRQLYLALGVVALLLLLPLAATSTNAAVRWLNPRRWRALHKLIYLAAPLAIAHELLAWTNWTSEVGAHAILAVLLLGWRLIATGRKLWAAAFRRPAEV